MGWDFTAGASKKDIIAYLTKEGESTKCLAHTVKGNVLWTVHETKASGAKWIGCFLLGSSRNFGWGYKDMCESMHPYQYNCPLSYLDMVPVACPEWREGVKAYHAKAKIKLKVGDKVKLISGCSVPEVTVTSIKPLRAVANGKEYKLPRRYIDSVITTTP